MSQITSFIRCALFLPIKAIETSNVFEIFSRSEFVSLFGFYLYGGSGELENVAMRRHESRNCRFVGKHKRSYRDANSCPLCRSKMFFIFIDLLTFDVYLPIGRLSSDSTCTSIRSELSNAMKTKIHST